MSDDRPAIPRPLKRDVLIEAGYRCAIPHCRETTLQIHHVEDWAKVREHTFDNLIALCANCHDRVTRGHIDRKAVRQIKANLSVMNGRYGDLEQRLLRQFARTKTKITHVDSSLMLLLSNLIDDAMIWVDPFAPMSFGIGDGLGEEILAGPRLVHITDDGQEFIDHWLAAEPLG